MSNPSICTLLAICAAASFVLGCYFLYRSNTVLSDVETNQNRNMVEKWFQTKPLNSTIFERD